MAPRPHPKIPRFYTHLLPNSAKRSCEIPSGSLWVTTATERTFGHQSAHPLDYAACRTTTALRCDLTPGGWGLPPLPGAITNPENRHAPMPAQKGSKFPRPKTSLAAYHVCDRLSPGARELVAEVLSLLPSCQEKVGKFLSQAPSIRPTRALTTATTRVRTFMKCRPGITCPSLVFLFQYPQSSSSKR